MLKKKIWNNECVLAWVTYNYTNTSETFKNIVVENHLKCLQFTFYLINIFLKNAAKGQ